jgi:hypothetical protein
MKSILLNIGLSIGLLLASFSFVFAQTYSYNFGTIEAAHTSGASTTFFSDTPTNGGTYRVRIGSGEGNFSLVNPGSSLGTGNEGVLTAATSTSANKFGIYDWAEATSALHLKFKFRTTSSTTGNLVVYVGNSTPGSDNQGYTSSYNNSLAIFWISYSSGNLNTVNRRQLGSNTSLTGSGFAKDTDHDVEIFANNAPSTATYTKGETNYTLAAQSWDLWVDGVKVSPANGWGRANNPGLASGDITGFGFFAESSTSNAAQIILDDLEYSPVLPFVAPTEPTISSTLANVTKRNYAFGGGPSATSTFNVSGSNLTGNVTLTPSANIEISLSDGSSFSATNPISVAGTGGTLNATPVYVRLKAGLAEASYASDNITIQTTGADDVVVNVSGKVYDAFAINYSNNLRLEDEVDRAQAQGFTLSNAVFNPAADGRIDISVNGFIQSPSIDLSDFDALEVSFGLQNFGSGSNRVLTLQLSSNDGETYSDLGEFPINSSSQIVSTTTVDLSAFTTTTLGKLRFTMTGGTGGIRFRDLSIEKVEQSSTTITGAAGYRFLSSPVRTTIDKLLKQNSILTQCFTGADETGEVCGTNGVGPNVFTWNTSSGAWVAATNVTNTIPAGSGVLVYVFDTESSGGNMNRTMNVRGVRHALPVSPALNASADGFTLVGNPSASTLSFNALTYENLYDVAFVWDPNFSGGTAGEATSGTPGAGSWRSWNNLGGELTDGLIAPFQAFFVATNANGTPSLSIAEGAISGSAGSFRGKTTTEEGYALSLGLSGEGLRNTTWFTFSPGGAPGADNADAVKLRPLSANYALLSSEGDSGVLLDINNLPLTFDEIALPLHVETTASGSFTLELGDFRLEDDIRVRLLDRHTGVTMEVHTGFSYTFTHTGAGPQKRNFGDVSPEVALATPGNNSRFVILFTNSELTSVDPSAEMPAEVSLDQNYPNPFNPMTQIRYSMPNSQFVNISVFDLTGRRLAVLVDGEVSAGSQFVNFDASALSSGVYIYRLQTGGQTIVRKMTVLK